MTPLQPFTIAGYTSGLHKKDKKPFLIPDKAFSVLKNAYVYRERVIKRQGLELVGRLTKTFQNINFFVPVAAQNLYALLVITGTIVAANNANPGQITTQFPHGLTTGDQVIITGILGATGYNNVNFTITVVDPTNFTIGVDASGFGAYISGGFFISNHSLASSEPNAEIKPGSVVITIHAGPDIVLTDQGNGTLTSPTPGNNGSINYDSGLVIYNTTAAALTSTSITFSYYPSLPVMGIESRDLSTINNEQTIFFDTKYAYTFDGVNFNWISPYTWSGTDADFFSSTNYQGADSSIRTFFVTNFVDDAGSPIRYTQDGTVFTDFAPQLNLAGTQFLLQARILIPYYGRLLAFNTIEGLALGDSGNKNYFNRVRFSQVGNPLDPLAWSVDIFGRGGLADAPTAETIIGVAFWKNTLIVFFERSTWQLRYVGEYGTPFLFERISSDFGSESTFSSLLFDQGILAIGDRAIVSATSTSVNRIDEDIPDQVFDIRNVEAGPERVQGVRDFQRELAFWSFTDSEISNETQYFPNSVLVYNYRNNTFAIFRDNVTAFGTLQPATGITWDSTDIFWDDDDVTWDSVQNNALFPKIVAGNQQGFIHYYGYVTPDEPSLSITGIDLTTTPITITVPNHNMENEEVVYVEGLQFLDTFTPPSTPLTSDLNDKIYSVQVVDDNTLSLFRWSFEFQQYYSNFDFTPVTTAVYIGGGSLRLFPRLDVQTKDFNPFAPKGKQLKVSYIDFLMAKTQSAAFTINLFFNTTSPVVGTIPTGKVGQSEAETYVAAPYYGNNTNPDILWHRFAQTIAGQFIRVQMTYDNNLMNTLTTHQQDWELNAMTLHLREGGKQIF